MVEFLDTVPVSVEHIDNGITFDIIVIVFHGDSYAKVRIANYHTNIVLVEKDGEKLVDVPVEGESEEGLTDRSLLDMESIWDFANTVDIEDVKEVLDRQGKLRGKYRECVVRYLWDGCEDPCKGYGSGRFGRAYERV